MILDAVFFQKACVLYFIFHGCGGGRNLQRFFDKAFEEIFVFSNLFYVVGLRRPWNNKNVTLVVKNGPKLSQHCFVFVMKELLTKKSHSQKARK